MTIILIDEIIIPLKILRGIAIPSIKIINSHFFMAINMVIPKLIHYILNK
jgi:hypothetical protein